MGTIEGGLGDGMRGKFGRLSIYKMKGVDKPVIRQSGGHTKEKIKNDPQLHKFRRAGAEFGGRAVAAKYVMQSLIFHKPLADYNIAGPLISLMKPVQELDLTAEWGERNVLLSQHPHVLRGFPLNRAHPFDQVLRYPVTGMVNRSTLSATVYIPEQIPKISFHPPVEHPYYSFRIALGIVPDIVYDPYSYKPVHHDFPLTCALYRDTEWLSLLQGGTAIKMPIQHDLQPPNEYFTLVLTIGIRYGTLNAAGEIVQVPYAGSAKILEVG